MMLAPDYPEAGPPNQHGVTLTAYVNSRRPPAAARSRSPRRIPLDRPVIDFNYLSEPDDTRCAIAGVRWNLRILYAKAFDDIRGQELAPGVKSRSDADIESFVRRTASTYWHPVGTCKMGNDEMAVVDDRLRVRGIRGAAGRRRVDHAEDRERQYACADYHDRRKGGGPHSQPLVAEGMIMSTRSRPICTDPDKRMLLDDLASRVHEGAVVAVGGGLSSREPMALLRAILRRGVTGLTVVGSAHGIDIDLLSAGGALSRSSESYVGFEQFSAWRRIIGERSVRRDQDRR